MDTAVSPIPAGMTEDNYHLIRDALFDSTYRGPKERNQTIVHSARGWTEKRLAALVPPVPGARVSFVIATKGTESGFANTGWNPIAGQSALEAWQETMIPITRLRTVIYARHS